MAVIKIYSTVVVVFVIISHNQTYSEDYNSIDQNSTNQKKLKGMDSKFKVAHKATLRLKKLGPKELQEYHENLDDIADLQKATHVILDYLVEVQKDIADLKSLQDTTEAEETYNCPDKGAISNLLIGIAKGCMEIVNSVEKIGKQLENAQDIPPKHMARYMAGIGNKFLILAEGILTLAEYLEATAKNMLSCGDVIENKGNMSLSLREQLRMQGLKLEYLGDKLGITGDQFKTIGEKFLKFGHVIETEEGSNLAYIGERFLKLCDKIKGKGRAINKIGANMENSKTGEVDKANKEDVITMEINLESIEKDLEDIVKNLGELNIKQKFIEDDLKQHYPGRGKILKKADRLAKECRWFADKAGNLREALGKVKDLRMHVIAEPILRIAGRLGQFGDKVVHLAQTLIDLGQNLLNNGEYLQRIKRLNPSNKEKFDLQRKYFKYILGKLYDIGEKVKIIGKTLNSVGERIKEPNLNRFGKHLENLGDQIKEKGYPENETEIKSQNIIPSLPDKQPFKHVQINDTSVVLKGLDEMANGFAEMRQKIKDSYRQPKDFVGKFIMKRETSDKLKRLIDEIERLEKQAMGMVKELNILEGMPVEKREIKLQSFGSKLIEQVSNTLEMAENLENLSKIMEKNGNKLRDEGRCDWMNNFKKQGEMWMDFGVMLEGIAGKIKVFGDIGKSVWGGNQSRVENVVETLRVLEGQIKSKGSNVQIYGRKLQNLGECTPKMNLETCGENLRNGLGHMQKLLDGMVKDAKDMEKRLRDLKDKQKDIDGKGEISKELRKLMEEREGMADDITVVLNGLHLMQNKTVGEVGQGITIFGEMVLVLADEMLSFVMKLENVELNALNLGVDLKREDKLTKDLKEKYRIEGENFIAMGRRIGEFGKQFIGIGKLLGTFGVQLGICYKDGKEESWRKHMDSLGMQVENLGDTIRNIEENIKNTGAMLKGFGIRLDSRKKVKGVKQISNSYGKILNNPVRTKTKEPAEIKQTDLQTRATVQP